MRRHLQIGALLSACAVLATTSMALLGPAGSASADTLTRSGQVVVDSLPGAQPILIQQFDPTLGDLTGMTVVAHLTGGVDAQVWNLSSTPRATTLTFSANGDFVGPASVHLTVALAASSSATLPAGGSTAFHLSDADQSSTVVNDAATLAAFTGTGTVTFDLIGTVQNRVTGPSRWRTEGAAHAEASIEVQYEYNRPTTTTSTSTTTTSTTTTTVPTTTSTSTTSTSTSTTSTSTTSTSTTSTSTTTTTTTPPSACPSPTLIEDWTYDVNDSPNWTPHTYLDGRFTITKLYFENLPGKRWPTAFDFTSTVPVTYVAVQSHVDNGQQTPPNEYFFNPSVTSGTHLHPTNPDPDGYLGRVKDIWVCLGKGAKKADAQDSTTTSATTAVGEDPSTEAPTTQPTADVADTEPDTSGADTTSTTSTSTTEAPTTTVSVTETATTTSTSTIAP